MLEPLFQAAEEISDNAKGKSCQELSGYIQQFITGFLPWIWWITDTSQDKSK